MSSMAYTNHLNRLEHRRSDVTFQEQEVGRACEELIRRRKALNDEENWIYKPEAAHES